MAALSSPSQISCQQDESYHCLSTNVPNPLTTFLSSLTLIHEPYRHINPSLSSPSLAHISTLHTQKYIHCPRRSPAHPASIQLTGHEVNHADSTLPNTHRARPHNLIIEFLPPVQMLPLLPPPLSLFLPSSLPLALFLLTLNLQVPLHLVHAPPHGHRVPPHNQQQQQQSKSWRTLHGPYRR